MRKVNYREGLRSKPGTKKDAKSTSRTAVAKPKEEKTGKKTTPTKTAKKAAKKTAIRPTAHK